MLITFQSNVFICRDMSKICVLLLCLYFCTGASSLPEESENSHHSINTCHVGDVIQNECIKCLCTTKSMFECKAIDCNKSKELEKVETESKEACMPDQLYVQNLMTCICNKNGSWPHKNCLEEFLSLPTSKLEKHKCEPNTYVKVDCNVCRCGPDGILLENRCTNNVCEGPISRRIGMNGEKSDSKPSNIYSSCEVKTWYSLAPCQFCFCVNENKLVCNTGHYVNKKLEVGKYNMEICGTDMLNEAMELIPEDQRSLRQGSEPQGTVLTATEAEPTTTQPDSNENNQISNANTDKSNNDNENRSGDDDDDDNGDDEEGDDQNDGGSEESDEGDNSPPGMIDMGKSIETSQFDDNDDRGSNDDESGDEESKEDNSNEASGDINPNKQGKGGVRSDTLKVTSKNLKGSSKRPFQDLEFVDNTLKINVPNVLNKVFEMALRKSMVSLNNGTHCTPGATTMRNCNMCFCLKNGKELCTANKCPNKE